VKNRNKITLLILLLILPPFIIFLSRHFFPSNYFFSSIYKIIFLLPLFFRFFIEKKTLKQSFAQNFSLERFKNNLWPMIITGIVLAATYVSAFFIFKDALNLSLIATKLQGLISIDLSNLIFIGLYIVIFNSLLEEFFWRGFLFQELRNTVKPWLAYVLTGIAFSFHHVMFYYNWFNLPFFLVVTIGLILYAVIMNLLFERYKDLFSCWMVHAFVDVVQIFIAFSIFIHIK